MKIDDKCIVFICLLFLCSSSLSNEENEKFPPDNLIGFKSNFPQTEWDLKRQTGHIIGSEPVLFLDDTFILGSKNITRSLHSLKKRLSPLSFPIADKLIKSVNVTSIIPSSDGDGLFVYCQGCYNDKSLFMIFRTIDGITFIPVNVNQIPSEIIWSDLSPNERPARNNVLNLNFADDFGMDFPPYYAAFFRVTEENNTPYRAIIINAKPKPRKAMILHSKDGLTWKRMPNQVLHKINYETNQPTYDPFYDRYLCYLRLWDPQYGLVSRWRKVIFNEAIISSTGIRWTDEALVFAADEADGPSTDIYYMQVTGYAGVYIGIPVLYHRPSSLNLESVGKFHCELAYSHNGREWVRVCQGQPFLETGPVGSWDGGMIGPTTNPVIFNDSLYYYYWGRKYSHDDLKPSDYSDNGGLASLRIDGFVSMDAGEEMGILVTTPFWPNGKYLYINAEASDGEIRVEVLQDYSYVEMEAAEKNPNQVKGFFRAENAIPFTGNALAYRVEWKGGENFVDNFPDGWNEGLTDNNKKRPFSKRAIALKFYMKNTRLYSFWFADKQLPLDRGRLIRLRNQDQQ